VIEWLRQNPIVVGGLISAFVAIYLGRGNWQLQKQAAASARREEERRREEEKQAQAQATVEALRQKEIEDGASQRNDWQEEIKELREGQRAANVQIMQLMREFGEQAKIIAIQQGEITVLKERALGLMEERDRLKNEAGELRQRVRVLEPLQEQVKHLQSQVRDLEARLQQRRVTDGGAV
jgi:chromosome segregation ATPase